MLPLQVLKSLKGTAHSSKQVLRKCVCVCARVHACTCVVGCAQKVCVCTCVVRYGQKVCACVRLCGQVCSENVCALAGL